MTGVQTCALPICSSEVIDLTIDNATEKNAGETFEGESDRSFRVHGVVADPNGRPVAGVSVRAAHQSLRTATPLGGPTVSDSSGQYTIVYRAEEVDRFKNSRANLTVQVYDPADQILAESPIRFQAKASETINIILDRENRLPLSYAQIVKRLEPIMEGASLADMGKREIAFLAGESGIAAVEIARAVRAERAGRATRFPAAAFYGYLSAREEGQGKARVDFWDRVASDYGLRADEMIVFRFIAPAGEMVDFDPSMVDLLLTMWRKEEMFCARDLALWDADRWQTVLKRLGPMNPHPCLPGPTAVIAKSN